MSSNGDVVWGIHGGPMGKADHLFVKHNQLALGWPKMGDLSKLPANREAFKQRLKTVYPKSDAAVAATAGQLYRFVHEMRVGDYVVYPSSVDRMVHIGRVSGPYVFSEDHAAEFPQRRAVEWKAHVPRLAFSQAALYEAGSWRAFFQIRDHAEEFIAAASGKSVQPSTYPDDTVDYAAETVQQTTRDFILKALIKELKGDPFARLVAHLLNIIGYRTRVSAAGPDGGVDIIAHKDEFGLEPPIIKVQVKSSPDKVGQPQVSALLGTLGPGEYALFFTLGTYTPQAQSLAKAKSNVRLLDGNDVVDLILEHYEELDGSYKAIIPLRKVYIPEGTPGEDA